MEALHFAYWLRGYTEVTNGAHPTPVQWQVIQDHLNEVFTKVTSNRHDPTLSIQTVSPCGGVLGSGLRARFQLPSYDPNGVVQAWSIDHTC